MRKWKNAERMRELIIECGRLRTPAFFEKIIKKLKNAIDKPVFIIYNIKRSPGY